MSRFMPLMIMFVLLTISSASAQDEISDEPRWWKGNLHTHSFWSDGNDFPEMIADWYLRHDYNFLALSDHNILSEGQKWLDITKINARAAEGVLERYRERFGQHWVETRPSLVGNSEVERMSYEVRLKPLSEFAPLLEQSGQFIMIPGEEISDRAEGKPVHMNASNVRDLIEPAGGETVRETIRNNLRAVMEQEKQLGRKIMVHVNHPNFGYALTAEDIASVVQERFFEVYNGHPGVNQLGDDDHPSIEMMWDIANAIRLGDLESPPLLGIATDDSHEYHGRPGSRPGRGWVMVRSRFLTPEHLINAMRDADFYASSGVVLDDIQFSEGELRIEIQAEEGADYKTQFVASVQEGPDAEPQIGVVVAESTDLSPTYKLSGNELYVRAVVTSSKPHPDPSFDGQHPQAWTQPVGWVIAP